MDRMQYVAQWNEVRGMAEGKTFPQLREMFNGAIADDIPVGVGVKHAILDIRYKDIRVTFLEKRKKASIQPWIECYTNEGVFLGVVNVLDESLDRITL